MKYQIAFIMLLTSSASCHGDEQRVDIIETRSDDLPRITKIRQVTQGPKHHFFGYYAICPWDASERYLACMEADFGNRPKKPMEVAGICVINTTTGEMKRVAETTAWNFQQGALVHWVGKKPQIIFNDVVDGKLSAVILDVETGKRRVLPRAITSVAPDGSWAACISFGRLNTTRPGYGYPGVEDPYADQPHPREDGIWRMELDTGECTLLASMDDVYHASPPLEAFRENPMWMNLVLVSRDGGHAAFLSRYHGEKGWYTSLFTVGADGSNVRCVIPYSWGGSHFDWVDGQRLVITTRLHGTQGGHVLFTQGKEDHRLLSPDILTRDGHCHVSWDGRWMVTDSYPVGSSRMQHLYIMDMTSEEVALVGRFHQPSEFTGDWRCDLHPRWSRDSKKLCIDSTHDGSRQLYVLELELPEDREDPEAKWSEAEVHGARAREVFTRCNRMVHAWYKHRGKDNWLIPDNLKTRIWRPENAAADNWSFWVLATYLTDREAYEGIIRKTLQDEIRLTTRLGWLPDAYHIDTNRFERAHLDLNRVIFGASEYVKDGLLPISELLGRTVWFERARGILDDIFRHAPLETKHGKIPSSTAEVNGEILQSLCRFYFATGDHRYKEWAERIGDAYFLDALPKCNGLPCHDWDFAEGKPIHDFLSLSDHGNEIIMGLSELVILEHACDPAKAQQYLPAMRKMVDVLLEVAVNEHGLWVHSIQPSEKRVLHQRTPDTWGYALHAVYALWMITGENRYREAVQRALRGIHADPKYRDWGDADSFADSIESAIVLFHRIPEPEVMEWLEATVPVFLEKQREDGIVEGWHGDGNYVRTALMYALMKTAGTHVERWRQDLSFGAVVRGNKLHISIQSENPWSGRLFFDYPRHRVHLGLPMNYPRLNEFPEWFPVESARLYRIEVDHDTKTVLGDELILGFPVTVDRGPVRITLTPLPGPSYGSRIFHVEMNEVHVGGSFELPVKVFNHTGQVQQIKATASLGSVEPDEGEIQIDGQWTALLKGDAGDAEKATVEILSNCGRHFSKTVRFLNEPGLVGFHAFNAEVYKDTPYQWCGYGPLTCKLSAKAGKAHILRFFWGSKQDQRTAKVSVNEHEQTLTHGGYDGFQWVELEIPSEWVDKDSIELKITELPGPLRPAFLAEVRLHLK